MRLVKRIVATLAAAGSIFAVALAAPGTATADTARGGHGPHSLIGDITVVAPVNVAVVGNTIAVLGVIDN